MIGRNDLCWCGSLKKWKKCHFPVESSLITGSWQKNEALYKKNNVVIKNEQQIEGIRKAGKLAAKILEETCSMAKEGVTTEELNAFAHKLHLENGALPAPLNYGSPPFPKSICTSLNEVICHGIPNDIPLKKGDILNIDVTCILNGYFGDCSKMVEIEPVSVEKRLVSDVSYDCLMKAIAIIKPGILLNKIGEIIETYAEIHGCSVVNQFVGHGVGLKFHEGPQVCHHKNNNLLPLAPGMIFTIEPMINGGSRKAVVDPYDKWTARTEDLKPSAQFEHTILVTPLGCEILTPWKK